MEEAAGGPEEDGPSLTDDPDEDGPPEVALEALLPSRIVALEAEELLAAVPEEEEEDEEESDDEEVLSSPRNFDFDEEEDEEAVVPAQVEAFTDDLLKDRDRSGGFLRLAMSMTGGVDEADAEISIFGRVDAAPRIPDVFFFPWNGNLGIRKNGTCFIFPLSNNCRWRHRHLL